MRLMIWHNILWPTYKGAVFSELHRLAVGRGHDLTIVHIAETEADRRALGPVDLSWHRYPYALLFKGAYGEVSKLKLWIAIATSTWKTKSDLTVVAGYHRPEYWLQAFIVRGRGGKLGLFCDSTAIDNRPSPLKELAKRFIFQMAHVILCYGQKSRDYVLSYGVDPRRVVDGCQAAAIPPDYRPEAALSRRLNAMQPSDEPRFLFVGRLAEEKSIDTLIKAFARLRAVHAKARLVIVGAGPDEEALRSVAARLTPPGAVTFVGSRHGPELDAEYASATCLVLPSRSEPWGLVVNEALSQGCPAVVSDRCGCRPELIVEGRTGWSFPWNDEDRLVEVLAAASDLCADRAATARACIDHIASYSPSAAATRILNGCERAMEPLPAKRRDP